MPRVVAIVLNWNLPAETRSCVEQLRASGYPDLKVIIVDNGSTDGSPERLRAWFPDVEILALGKNRGFAAGNNVGVRRALALGADWILLVNNDAVLAPDALQRLIDAASPGVGLAMPRIDALPSGRLWNAGARLRGLNPLPRPLREADLAAGKPLRIDFAVGCVLLIRRDVVETIGLLDERYFMYYEDLDFCARARAAGFRIIVVPSARAGHYVGASLKKDSPRRTYLLARYRTLWTRSQAPGLGALAWWGTLVIAALRGIASAILDRDRASFDAVIQGLRDGLRQSER